MKTCRGCDRRLPTTDFSVDRSHKDGRASRCKGCRSSYEKEWAERPGKRQMLTASKRAYAAGHRDQLRTAARQSARRRYWADPERHRSRARQDGAKAYAANPDKFKAQAAAWYHANQQRAMIRQREYMRSHPEARAALADLNRRRRAVKMAAAADPIESTIVFAADGYVCQLCFLPTSPDGAWRERPSIDHIIPLSRGGSHTYANVQTAHIKCNAAKGNRSPAFLDAVNPGRQRPGALVLSPDTLSGGRIS